jgi:FkbH-like protein
VDVDGKVAPVTDMTKESVAKPPQLPNGDGEILLKRRALRRELLKQNSFIQTRIALLGGSTTAEVKGSLELFLLAHGIQPTFYESGYNRYYEDILSENPELWSFKPDIVCVHTTWHNVSQFPESGESAEQVEGRVRHEMARFESMWDNIHKNLGAVIIQNNFDLPRHRTLGNLEAAAEFGRVNFLLRLNAEFANYARKHSRFLINDILYLSAQAGLAAWHDDSYWYRFHMAVSPKATVGLGRNVAGMIKAVYGKTKKCLVLDLDNTLWGGVIGDDGLEKIVLGRDNAIGETFIDFQRYVKALQRRGVILAVCSKNDLENAREGFRHPDSVLKVEDFSAFQANWDPKPENIRKIAAELNIGLDSMVFVDDNPVERALVAEELPEVAVPDVGSDVTCFAGLLEQARYFELEKLVAEDINRSAYYSANGQRDARQSALSNYGDFLASLEMTSEIGPFRGVYIERIAQLINKTNQFNLTTRRYTSAEVESIVNDPSYVALYGRLADKFGDNGLVSVVIGRINGTTLEVDLWLMSCRVLKREMEFAMFDALVERCQQRGIRRIIGVYIPSNKNSMVAGHYEGLGFTCVEGSFDNREVWQYDVPETYAARTRHIRRTAAEPLRWPNV